MSSKIALTAAGLALAGGALVTRRMRRRSFYDNVVVITGGARGLGLEMARLWGDEGSRVAICSRNVNELSKAASELHRRGVPVLGRVCDVTDPEQVRQFINVVTERWGHIDVVVNNAGVIQVGPVDCMTHDDYEMAMQTHFWGPLSVIEAVLPGMRRRQKGSIVNIASIGGKLGVPHLVPYSASKFALVGLSEGLRAELAPLGISVVTVCPGLMRTGSARNALFKGKHRAEYAWFSISNALPGVTISSTRAARQIIEACRRGSAQLVITWSAKAAVHLHDLCPSLNAFLVSMVNRVLPKRGSNGCTTSVPGYRSFSRWSPSVLTTLLDRAARRNNEIS